MASFGSSIKSSHPPLNYRPMSLRNITNYCGCLESNLFCSIQLLHQSRRNHISGSIVWSWLCPDFSCFCKLKLNPGTWVW